MTLSEIAADSRRFNARQARYWREQEHLMRMELLHDLADRCAARAAEYELEPAWSAIERGAA